MLMIREAVVSASTYQWCNVCNTYLPPRCTMSSLLFTKHGHPPCQQKLLEGRGHGGMRLTLGQPAAKTEPRSNHFDLKC